MNVFENQKEFTSLRKYYSDTSELSIENEVYILSPVFTSILNKNGIYQIDDTIFVETPNHSYIIENASINNLNVMMPYFNSIEIDENLIPEGVSIIKVFKKNSGLTKEQAIQQGAGYDYSFTRADEHDILGKRYKNVAVVHDFSRNNYTIYAFETKYEIGKSRRGNWFYTPFKAHWLNLFVETYFDVKSMILIYPKYFSCNVTNSNTSGIYREAYKKYDNNKNNLPVVFVQNLNSTHVSHLHSKTYKIFI